jgi:GxxExxY protein
LNHEGTKDTKPYRTPEARALADALSGQVIAAVVEVHRELGPGLLESVYETCLARELDLRGIGCRRQVPLPITYKGVELDTSHRLDMLVEDVIVVELKAVDCLAPIHDAQLLTYLRLSGRWLGLLVNFNTDLVKHGLRRLLNG